MLKKTFLLLSLYIFASINLFSMDAEQSYDENVAIELITFYQTIADQTTDQQKQQILSILQLRKNVIDLLFMESCLRKTFSDLTIWNNPAKLSHQPVRRFCHPLNNMIAQQKEAVKKAYIDAEIAYSEADCTIKKTLADINVLFQKDLAKHFEDESEFILKNYLMYENLQPLLNARCLSEDEYKQYLWNKGLKDVGIIHTFADLYFNGEMYKMHLFGCYKFLYKDSTSKNQKHPYPQEIFGLDCATASLSFQQLVEVNQLIYQAALCKISKEFVELKDSLPKSPVHAKNLQLCASANLNETDLATKVKTLTFLTPSAQQDLIRLVTVGCYQALVLYHNYINTCILFKQKNAAIKTLPQNIIVIFDESTKPNYLETLLQPIIPVTKSITDALSYLGITDTSAPTNKPTPKKKKDGKRRKKATLIEKTDTASLAQCHEQLSAATSSTIHTPATSIVVQSPTTIASSSISAPEKTISETTTLPQDNNATIITKILTEQSPQATSSSTTPILPALLDGLPTYVEGSDIAVTCTKNKTTVGCVIDLERGIDGGYQNKIFIYPSSDTNQSNILANLNYADTVTSKGNYLTDNNHAFSRLVEKYFGHYGIIQSQTELSTQDTRFKEGYRYKQEIRISGTITSLVYPTTRIFWKIDQHKNPANGSFEFTILRKKLDDQKEKPLCIHRFFNPLR